MEIGFRPEGELLNTKENRDLLSSRSGPERAMKNGTIIEGVATVCDGEMRLSVDLGCMRGIIFPEEAVWCRPGESRKDIAVVSRVGKPVAVKVLSFTERNGETVAILSRRAAQKECLDSYLTHLRAGDIILGRVTHMEPFGAFLDIGCGVSSLLSVDCISVSRISHPRDRLSVGMLLPVAVKNVDRESGRISVTLRELLGTWEENAARFAVGETVCGVVRQDRRSRELSAVWRITAYSSNLPRILRDSQRYAAKNRHKPCGRSSDTRWRSTSRASTRNA